MLTFLGGWTSMVSAKATDVDLAKDYVKWLWIDNTQAQEDFNLSYGFSQTADPNGGWCKYSRAPDPGARRRVWTSRFLRRTS